QGGNGLGLSIAEKIVQLNGGMIQVESELQKYTTFKISFPVLN
ncbi:ATP-binding protein, partial [Staphylococcus epidermidis]